MAPHYQEEPVVAYEAVTRSEAILNNHSKAWAKLLRLGADAGEGMLQRIQNALQVHDSNVPGLQGLRKDHKRYEDKTTGPPLRPLCNGKVGPNAPLANILARLIKLVREGLHQTHSTEVLSTEEVLNPIQSLNNSTLDRRIPPTRSNKIPSIQGTQLTIGSMDVSANLQDKGDHEGLGGSLPQEPVGV